MVPSVPTRTVSRSFPTKQTTIHKDISPTIQKKPELLPYRIFVSVKNRSVIPYLVTKANFIACHNFSFVEKVNMLDNLEVGGSFLLTSEYDKDTVWSKLPGRVQKQIIDKKAKFYVIDAFGIGHEIGLGARINTIMQTAFFKISKVIDDNTAIESIKICNQENLR